MIAPPQSQTLALAFSVIAFRRADPHTRAVRRSEEDRLRAASVKIARLSASRLAQIGNRREAFAPRCVDLIKPSPPALTVEILGFAVFASGAGFRERPEKRLTWRNVADGGGPPVP